MANHNLETVPRLYLTVRPGAPLLCNRFASWSRQGAGAGWLHEIGVMVGLGESREKNHAVMDDLRAAQVDFYHRSISPASRSTAAVARFWTPEESRLEQNRRGKGFPDVLRTRYALVLTTPIQTLRRSRPPASKQRPRSIRPFETRHLPYTAI